MTFPHPLSHKPDVPRQASPLAVRMAGIVIAGGLALGAPLPALAQSAPSAAPTAADVGSASAGAQASPAARVPGSAAMTGAMAGPGAGWHHHARRGNDGDRCSGARGERDGHAHSMRGGHGKRAPFAGLALSQEQRDRIFAIRHAAEPQFREQAKKLRDLREQFHQAAAADAFDEAKVRGLAEQQGQAMAEMMQMRARQMKEIHDVLTPEQKEKLQQRRESRQRAAPRGWSS